MAVILPANRRPGPSRTQGGMMLLEALVAILIFSLGILGLLGLQATAVQQSSDSQYRAQAAQLVEQLLGQMWSGNRTATYLQNQYNSCGTSACAGYQSWYSTVAATLPGVGTATTMPTVSVDPAGVVAVSVFWRQPSDGPTASPHRYDTSAQIGQ